MALGWVHFGAVNGLFWLNTSNRFLHIVTCLQIFVQPLFAEFKAVRFGSFFGFEYDAFEVFDMNRAIRAVYKDIAVRAPPVWRVEMDSHSLSPNKIAFVWNHFPLADRPTQGCEIRRKPYAKIGRLNFLTHRQINSVGNFYRRAKKKPEFRYTRSNHDKPPRSELTRQSKCRHFTPSYLEDFCRAIFCTAPDHYLRRLLWY
jgi:hypothetical protein